MIDCQILLGGQMGGNRVDGGGGGKNAWGVWPTQGDSMENLV